MFGPMILNQVTKFQRNRQRRQPQGPPHPHPQQRRRVQESEHVQYKDLNKELGRDGRGRAVSAEERDFNLKEEDIMLTKDDLKHYDKTGKQVDELSSDHSDLSDVTSNKKKPQAKPEEDDYDEFFES